MLQAEDHYKLGHDDIEVIKQRASKRQYEAGSLIFSEGDSAEEMFIVESGRVSVVIQEFTKQESISSLGPGDYFGEMAFFHGDTRSASVVALEDSMLHCINRNAFLDAYESNSNIAAKFDQLLAQRNQELKVRETLIDRRGGSGKKLHIGIKGDPSLRESAFTRERFESVADKYLPALQSTLYDLLLNRSVYEVSIHFNSGELHFRTICDPLTEEIHPADKLVNQGYVARHFPAMDYAEKAKAIQRLYGFMGSDSVLEILPAYVRADFRKGFANWQPVSPTEIIRVLSKLPLLRKISNFYIRNFTMSTLRDVIRLQFNCDGAHIVNAAQFAVFLEENLPMDDLMTHDASSDLRKSNRRGSRNSAAESTNPIERRAQPGRRQKDWEAHMGIATDAIPSGD